MNADTQLYKAFQKSPIYFIEKIWSLTPQPLKKEYREETHKIIESVNLETYNPDWSKEIKSDWFEPFEKGKHITWQQWLLLIGVELALQSKAPKRLTVESGHGTGKSAVLSMLCIWYLFCFKNAQIPCTAPTADQMYDVLWKEIKLWLDKMPQSLANLFDWTTSYIRVKEAPETWFARAKTARKEAPEALAGIHGEFVMVLIDEASGVPEEIYKTAEGTLTGENILVILISNHTRLIGYFHDSHNADKQNFQCFRFNSEESPIVDIQFVERIITKYGKDSDEYRIRVLGTPPKSDAVDEKGYVPLLQQEDLKYCDDNVRLRMPELGVDPSGEGDDISAFVGRDAFRAKILASEKISTPMSIAVKATSLADLYGLGGESITVDNFGIGANVGMEMAHASLWINAINVGEKADDDSRFANKRAEGFFRIKDWLRSGGELVRDERWKELLNIRFKRNLAGKIVIMPKEEMRKMGIPSPNYADALMLTFLSKKKRVEKRQQLSDEEIKDLINVY